MLVTFIADNTAKYSLLFSSCHYRTAFSDRSFFFLTQTQNSAISMCAAAVLLDFLKQPLDLHRLSFSLSEFFFFFCSIYLFVCGAAQK